MKKTCKITGQEYEVHKDEQEFYERTGQPLPDIHPLERTRQRMAFWPFGKFHKRTCDATGEKIISIYAPDTRFPVYKNEYWQGDDWEPPQMEVDLSRDFFDQLYELQSQTPRPHQFGVANQDCDYADDVWRSKNCYLTRSAEKCENLAYSYRNVQCVDSFDLYYCYNMHNSYDCTYCFHSHNLKFAFDSRDCIDSCFLYDCRNCQNCFMCWNLRNEQYCIQNEQYTKEEYEEKIKEFGIHTYSGFTKAKERFKQHLKEDAIHKANFNLQIENSTGNYLYQCKNMQDCYFMENAEEGRYVFRGLDQRDTFDCTGAWAGGGELCLNSTQVERGYNVYHTNFCSNCQDSEYLDTCQSCSNCFGCVGLNNQQYCILNKQYTKEKYEEVVGQIKEAMKEQGTYGQFFPYKMMVTGYNLSLAQFFMPMKKEEADRQDILWDEIDVAAPEGIEIVEPADDINDVTDDILQKGIRCTESQRVFNLMKDELRYLRHHQIPVPRRYPDMRTLERVRKMSAFVNRTTTCYYTGEEITTDYPEEWGYQKIVTNDEHRNRIQ